MEEQILEQSKKFWSALEKSDVDTMRAIADPNCDFVHIGITCDLDSEMEHFINKTFNPTDVTINSQAVKVYGDAAIVITDCNYSLLLKGEETTHHFAVTEVYILKNNEWRLVQQSFTALVY